MVNYLFAAALFVLPASATGNNDGSGSRPPSRSGFLSVVLVPTIKLGNLDTDLHTAPPKLTAKEELQFWRMVPGLAPLKPARTQPAAPAAPVTKTDMESAPIAESAAPIAPIVASAERAVAEVDAAIKVADAAAKDVASKPFDKTAAEPELKATEGAVIGQASSALEVNRIKLEPLAGYQGEVDRAVAHLHELAKRTGTIEYQDMEILKKVLGHIETLRKKGDSHFGAFNAQVRFSEDYLSASARASASAWPRKSRSASRDGPRS